MFSNFHDYRLDKDIQSYTPKNYRNRNYDKFVPLHFLKNVWKQSTLFRDVMKERSVTLRQQLYRTLVACIITIDPHYLSNYITESYE